MRRNDVAPLATLVAFCCALALAPQLAFALGDPLTGAERFKKGYVDGVDRVIGWQIQSVNPWIVGELGVLDYAQDGLVHSHEVGLWTIDGTLLLSGAVPAGTSAELFRNFRYVDVPDTSLPAGYYVIGATWPANGDEFVWDAAIESAPGYDVGGTSGIGNFYTGPDGTARSINSSTLAFPTQTVGFVDPADDRRTLWGPNVTRVPEPCSVTLAALVTAIGTLRARASRNRR